jgi:hypothetical protein
MGMRGCTPWLGWGRMEWCGLDINNKWELRQVGETRDEDGESMWEMIVMAVARNGYNDAHDPDEMR